MTPSEAAAELARLGVAVVAAGGRFRLAAAGKVIPPDLRAALTAHKGEVLGLLGVPCVRCPVCHDWVCPDRAAGGPGRVADCGPGRRPVAWAQIDHAGVYTTGGDPGCPFGGG
jgi:hypothetical protein